MQRLNDAMDDYWIAPEGRMGAASRRTSWVTNGGCRCTYKYGGGSVDPAPWPSCMNDILELVMPLCGILRRTDWPDSANLNRYSGTDSIGWHADDEPLFGGLVQDTRIISL